MGAGQEKTRMKPRNGNEKGKGVNNVVSFEYFRSRFDPNAKYIDAFTKQLQPINEEFYREVVVTDARDRTEGHSNQAVFNRLRDQATATGQAIAAFWKNAPAMNEEVKATVKAYKKAVNPYKNRISNWTEEK